MQSNNSSASNDSNDRRPKRIWVDNGIAFHRGRIEYPSDIQLQLLPGYHQEYGKTERISDGADSSTLLSWWDTKSLHTALVEFITRWNANATADEEESAGSMGT